MSKRKSRKSNPVHKKTAGQKENPSARRRCVCYTKSAYCLGMYAVLGLCQVLGAMQDDAAANSSAIRRVFFKKEAVRLAVIINDDLFCSTPLEMPPQDSSQLAPQNRPPGNLMEIFPAVELITRHEHFRDGKVVPLCAIHILSIFHKDMERLIGQPNILLPTVYFTGADLLKPGEPDLQHLHVTWPLRQPQDGKGTAVTGNQPVLWPLLQLLEFASQNGKTVGGFSGPGYSPNIQHFLIAS